MFMFVSPVALCCKRPLLVLPNIELSCDVTLTVQERRSSTDISGSVVKWRRKLNGGRHSGALFIRHSSRFPRAPPGAHSLVAANSYLCSWLGPNSSPWFVSSIQVSKRSPKEVQNWTSFGLLSQLQEKIRPVAQGVERPVGLFPATGLLFDTKITVELIIQTQIENANWGHKHYIH